MFDILNLLEDRLRHANSAVVLAATRVFLLATLDNAGVHQQACGGERDGRDCLSAWRSAAAAP